MLFQLRHHPLPKSEQFENLKNCAKSKGFDVKTSSNKALAETLDRCVDSKDPVVNKVSRSKSSHRYIFRTICILVIDTCIFL